MHEKKHTNYPSRFAIGESVLFCPDGKSKIKSYIRAIIFTNCKVRYSIYLKDVETTIHNVDSYFIDDDLDNVEDKVNFGDDDYS